MAKNKEEKTNVMRTLEQKKIPYTAYTYPNEEGRRQCVQDAGDKGRQRGILCVRYPRGGKS